MRSNISLILYFLGQSKVQTWASELFSTNSAPLICEDSTTPYRGHRFGRCILRRLLSSQSNLFCPKLYGRSPQIEAPSVPTRHTDKNARAKPHTQNRTAGKASELSRSRMSLSCSSLSHACACGPPKDSPRCPFPRNRPSLPTPTETFRTISQNTRLPQEFPYF